MRLKSFNLLKAASMRQRSLYRRLLNVNGSFLLERFGKTGLVQCSSSSSRSSALSYAVSPSMHFAGSTLRIRRSATGQSCASPPVNRIAIRRPLASASAWIFVLRPPRERPTACFSSPLFRRWPSGVLLHASSRSSACLRIVRCRQVAGIDFPRCRAAPTEQSGYRSWLEDHIRAGNRTSGNHFSTHARCH
jgi:hypothetical protein